LYRVQAGVEGSGFSRFHQSEDNSGRNGAAAEGIMNVPRMSIGLPVYNGEKYLRLALDSILQQDYTDFELIISDNASQDATEKICREYSAKDPRIRYYRNEKNIGASGNFNRVFELARGELFKWAAHDDVHLPGFFSRCIEVIDRAPATVVLVSPRAEVIDGLGNLLNMEVESLDARQASPHQRVGYVVRRVWWATALFGLIRTDVLRKTRLIQSYFWSDFVLLVEIASMGQIWELPETLFQRRYHDGISTNAHKKWRDLQLWFDPSGKGIKRFLPPAPRVGVEMVQAITRAPLPLSERSMCGLAFLMAWLPRECRRLCKTKTRFGIRSKLKRLLSKAFGRTL
jgi:glycosyltransferase involved in cell wall biosynthesis